MSAALPIESVRELLALAPQALFGGVATERVGRAEGGVESARPDEPLRDVASRMWWRKMGTLAVLDGERLVGVLSEDDLLHTLAERLRARADAQPDLLVWEALLADTSVRDAMTLRSDAAVVPVGTPLLDGLRLTFGATRRQRRKSYLFAVDAAEAPVRVISFRDIARHLMRLYDGQLPEDLFASAALQTEAQRVAWRVLDLTLGQLRESQSLGSPAEPLAPDASPIETIERMAARARGYATVATPAARGRPATLRGICTRRDVLRALANPFASLDSLRTSRLMTEPVKTVTDVDTLCGLFKMMAIEGFRHMPMVDEDDELVCVISMWQGVGLLAHQTRRANG